MNNEMKLRLNETFNEKKVEVAVPDTLDLVERAEQALHGISGTLDKNAGYEFYWYTNFKSINPEMTRDNRSFIACGPKVLDALCMMKFMSGNSRYDEAFHGLAELLVSWIQNDGLMYAPVGPNRPWDNTCSEDYANPYAQSRMMLAVMTMLQYTGEGIWLARIVKMKEALCRIALDKGEYAYYPANMTNNNKEGYCYTKSGWGNTDEASNEMEGYEGSMFMYHCGPIRALTKFYRISGDQKSIDMAGKLVKYVMRTKYWGSEFCWPKMFIPEGRTTIWYPKVIGSEHGHFDGHFHGHVAMLHALIEYAETVGDTYIKDFVRFSYEYARCQGIARVGLFGETCAISDMIAVAIKLSESGTGDYWDDVDGYVRNQLIEQQFTNTERMKNASLNFPVKQLDGHIISTMEYNDSLCNDHEMITYRGQDIIEKTAGVFIVASSLNCGGMQSVQCCTGNGTSALYFVWESIVKEEQDGHVRINLLINRVASTLVITSYIPYEGKVVIQNRSAKSLSVRIPRWVNKSELRCKRGKNYVNPTWASNYMILHDLSENEEIVLEFPMKEETCTYTVLRQTWTIDHRPEKNPICTTLSYECLFRGNTLIDVTPKSDGYYDPLYSDRHHYREGEITITNKQYPAHSGTIEW